MKLPPARDGWPLSFIGTVSGLVVFGASVAIGCHVPSTTYRPKSAPPTELWLRADNRLEIMEANKVVAQGSRFEGLERHVRCVPAAAAHARRSESSGRIGSTLATAGVVLGASSFVGLTGLAFLDSDPTLAAALLGGGAIVAVTGLMVGVSGWSYKQAANGHALDAMNEYNDARGSRDLTCSETRVIAGPTAPRPAQLTLR